MSLLNFPVILSPENFKLVRGKGRFGFGSVWKISRHYGRIFVACFVLYGLVARNVIERENRMKFVMESE